MGKKNKRNFGGNDKGNQKPKSFDQFDSQEQDALNIPFSKNQQLKLMPFTPRTAAQKEAYAIVKDNTLTFLGGPAGTGKTLLLCRVALEYLEKGLIKKIVVSRPAVEVGKSLGFMPGSMADKLGHFMIPIMENFSVFVGPQKLKKLVEEGVIEVASIGHLRGRNFHNTFLIIDEGQNLTSEEFYMALTRIGQDSFCGMTYDGNQVDIRKENSCVLDIEDLLGYDDIGDFEFDLSEVVRSKIVQTILWAREEAKKVKAGEAPSTFEE